jgi:hypothetical protein
MPRRISQPLPEAVEGLRQRLDGGLAEPGDQGTSAARGAQRWPESALARRLADFEARSGIPPARPSERCAFGVRWRTHPVGLAKRSSFTASFS